MRLNLFSNSSIFVFTPKHKVTELPKGATIIDLAYQAHTAVGHSVNFAQINWLTTNLSKTLNSGDIVEVILDPKNKLPTESWVAFAKTKMAQSLIKSGLRNKLRQGNRWVPRGVKCLRKRWEALESQHPRVFCYD